MSQQKLNRTEGNFNVHPAFSPILEKLKHNTPWPGQTEVKPIKNIWGPKDDKLRLPQNAILIDKKPVSNSEHLSVVLCRWNREYQTEFVTWIYNHSSKGCGSGRYFNNISDAVKDFEKRN